MTERITDLELEAYRDGEADPVLARRVAAALDADEAVRARLERIASLDAMLRDGLTATPGTARHRPRLGALVAGPLIAAAGLAIAVVLLRAAPVPATDPRPVASVESEPGFVEPAPGPLRTASAEDRAAFEVFAARVDRAATARDGSPHAERPSGATTPAFDGGTLRRERLLNLGREIRSAMRAEEELDAMPPGEQLEACGVWMSEPALRPVVFGRLGLLLGDRSVRDEVVAMIEELERDRTLASWVRSYGLAASAR